MIQSNVLKYRTPWFRFYLFCFVVFLCFFGEGMCTCERWREDWHYSTLLSDSLRMEGDVTGWKIRFLVIVVVHHRWRLVLVLLGHKLIIWDKPGWMSLVCNQSSIWMNVNLHCRVCFLFQIVQDHFQLYQKYLNPKFCGW